MKKDILISLIFCYGACGCQVKTDSNPPRNNNWDFPHSQVWRVGEILEQDLKIPDILGGDELWGVIDLDIRVHKSGRLLNYEIRRIIATLDTTNAPAIFIDLRPRVDVRTKSFQADSLVRIFTPWIDHHYKSIKFRVNKDNPAFAVYDTLTMAHSIVFKGKKQAEVM